jgi:hypothetical protein
MTELSTNERPAASLPEISDEQMKAGMTHTRDYSVVVLRKGPAYDEPSTPAIIWEHGRRNFALREAGLLAIVCPVPDESDLCGVGLFTTSVPDTEQIMAGDPGVRAGVFTAEVHPCRSFPGDALP